MWDLGVCCVYHLAQIVPAAGMCASATMLSVRLQGSDGGLHLASSLMFVVSAGIMALTHHRTYSALNFGRIAAILAIPSVIRLLIDSPSDAESWTALKDKMRYVVADYLYIISLVAFALPVGFSAPARVNPQPDFFDMKDYTSQWSQDFSIRSKSWSSRSSRASSDKVVGSKIHDWLSEASSIYFKHMGPSSKSSSRSSGADSEISLHSEPGRVDAARALEIHLQAKVALQGSQDREFQTIPQDLREVA